MTSSFRLGRRLVGPSHPTYFIADIAANHDGDLHRALELIRLAAEAGADAAKFQNFRADGIVSDRGFRDLGGQLGHQSSWTRSVSEVYADAAIPTDWTPMLRDACDAAGIDYLTAPYGLELIDALDPYVCAWKLGSGEITWTETIRRLAARGKPLLIATGAADLDDVDRALEAAAGCDELVLMQCNTNYTGSPDNFAHIELSVLRTYAERWPTVVLGLSDHTPGCATVLGAVALGARVVEKHFTDDNGRSGPDHGFSLDPPAWRNMVDRTRELQAALGTGVKRVMPNESETVVLQRRGIRAAGPLPAGTVLSVEDLVVLRPCPADALPPYRMAEVIGGTLLRPLGTGEHVRLTDLAAPAAARPVLVAG
jgi:sialic acid synthase SpsE